MQTTKNFTVTESQEYTEFEDNVITEQRIITNSSHFQALNLKPGLNLIDQFKNFST